MRNSGPLYLFSFEENKNTNWIYPCQPFHFFIILNRKATEENPPEHATSEFLHSWTMARFYGWKPRFLGNFLIDKLISRSFVSSFFFFFGLATHFSLVMVSPVLVTELTCQSQVKLLFVKTRILIWKRRWKRLPRW